MKLNRRILAFLTAASLLIGSASALAEGGEQGGPGGHGGPGGPGGQQGGQRGGGPQVTDETVDLSSLKDFTYGDLTLHVDGDAITLKKADEGQTLALQGETATNTKGTPRGMFNQTVLTVTGADDEETLTAWMPAVWADSKTALLKQDGTFVPDLDMNKALVAYTAQSVQNPDSVTGYSTTFTVSDPDHAFQSVWAYGMWMASPTLTAEGTIGKSEADYDTTLREPEAWENGMYYSGYGAREMTYQEESGTWNLTLDLASANMGVQCYHDVDKNAFSGDISVADDSTVVIPYDERKQSASFDWTLTGKNEQAGSVQSVTIGDGIELAIYTPYGYAADNSQVRYPVLYLIPGMMTAYNTWFTGGLADRIFDNLIAQGKVAPTILVTMTRDTAKMDMNDIWDSADDRSKQNGDGDGYINYVDGAEKGSGTENMIESLVVSQVVPYVDANYPTLADAPHRAIIGTSMGGVATTQIWMTANELFDYYGFFSGADMFFKSADDAKAADEYKALRPVYEEDYNTLLANVVANAEGKKILVGGGITDRNTFGGDQNSAGADNVDAYLTENGIEHVYSVVGGGHDWTTWTQLLSQFTAFLGEDSAWKTEESAKKAEGGNHGGFGGGKEQEGPSVYTNGNQALTLNPDGTFTLTGLEGGDIGGTYSMAGSTVTLDEENTEALASQYAWYWSKTLSVNNYRKTFSFAMDLKKAQVEYSYATAADADSVTGFLTTFTVPDKDKAYANVYAYGAWMAASQDFTTDENGLPTYDETLHAPEEWQNGMYYNGNSSIAMSYDKAQGAWTLTLPLACDIMGVQCYHDVADPVGDLKDVRLEDGKRIELPYDAEKQSTSPDLSVAFVSADAQGTMDYDVVCTAGDGTKIPLSVYLPFGYNAEDANTLYPVLYLIPGAGTNYATWFKGGLTNNIFDNLTSAGKVAPTVMVSMDREQGEAYLVSDIIPFIERSYHVYTDAEHRAVAGSSRGGVAASTLWISPETSSLFSCFGLFSGMNKAYFENDDYALSEEEKSMLGSSKVLLGGGMTDFNMFANEDRNSTSIYRASNWLNARGVDHGYLFVPGGHTWTTWIQLVEVFATEYLWK
ncbi:MAG: hypothetical protein IJ865_09120 [Clostridia bacterium]|nr:hypothetical protein [Clostridia bacterium]